MCLGLSLCIFIYTTKPYMRYAHKSELAQRKRVGPITQRSDDRNIRSLFIIFFAFPRCICTCTARWHRLEVYFGSGIVVYLTIILLIFCVVVILSLSLCIRARVYDVRNVPSSYRQPNGNGQLLSRRYCTHSGWLFSRASRTASPSHGALAVSCKYFKQSKWPYLAANQHAHSSYLSYFRSTRYSSM